MGSASRLVNARKSEIVSGEGVPVVNLMDNAKQQTADLIKYQKQTLAQSGVFPLESKNVTAAIDQAIEGTSSDLSKAVLKLAKDKIASKTDENGFISSRDLYDNVRKTLNQDIEAFLQQSGKPAQGGIPQQAAKTAGNVKQFIDASLDKSSNGLWSKYITDFAAHSQKLDRMAIGSVLEQKLGTSFGNPERAGAFTTAVENATATIKKGTGMPRYDSFEKIMTPKEISTINSIKADLARQSRAESMASGVTGLENAIPTPGKDINALNRTVTLAKSVLAYLEKGSQKEFDKKMVELTLNPKEMAAFIESFPASKTESVVSAMMKRMSPNTRSAFIQQFTIQPTTNQMENAGIPRIEMNGMAQP
jgi:hypothetical protein